MKKVLIGIAVALLALTGGVATAAIDATEYVTFYSQGDNDPPGSREITYPKSDGYKTIHNEAGGTGTYEDPVTFASSSAFQGQYGIGVRIYVPSLQKFFVLEDSCASCRGNWIELFIDSTGFSDAAATRRQEQLTKNYTVIIKPDSAQIVNTTPLMLFLSATPPEPPPPPPPPSPPPISSATLASRRPRPRNTTVDFQLGARRSQRALKQKGVVVFVRCPAERCKADVSATIRIPKIAKRLQLNRLAKALDRGQSAKLRLRLSRRQLEQLARALRSRDPRVKATATVTVSVADASRNRKCRTVTIRLTR